MDTTKERREADRTRKPDMTWSATQVGLRTVEAGLGGHDAGVSGGQRRGLNDIVSDIETESIGTV